MDETELELLRQRIDRLDLQIMQLLAQRQAVVGEIGALKAAVGRAVRDPVREAELLHQRRSLALELGLDPAVVDELWTRIMAQARRVQGEEP